MREGCKENETILENHGESFTRFQKVSKQAVAELCQAQVKFKLDLDFFMFIQNIDVIQMKFR